MHPNDDLTQLALDYLYGLADEEAADRLNTPDGRAALDRAEQYRALLARAATMTFPEATFLPPTVTPRPADPAPHVRWVGWVVAASVVAGLSIPASAHLLGERTLRRQALVAAAEADALHQRSEQIVLTWNRDKAAALAKATEARTTFLRRHRDVAAQVEQARQTVLAKQFNVVVSGPAAITPGTPNEFQIETKDLRGQLTHARLRTRVVDQAGRVVFEPPAAESRGLYKLRLPPDLPLTPDRELSLEVAAVGPAGPSSELKHKLSLAAPVYLAHLTTDKPLYQPGETVRFRALVLDRFKLKPATEDLTLTVTVLDPQGAEVFNLVGASRLAGSDQLRGLAAGEWPLPESAAGGEFTLRLREASGRLPEQSRKFLVNRYQPARLEKVLEFTRKSYGAGDEVVASCQASRVSGPLANQPVRATAQVDGKELPVEVAGTTDSQGAVAVKFRLPAQIDRGDASVSVIFTDGGEVETLVKPVPVVLNQLRVELFPEGGELIAGVPNRVYVQARTPLGRPAEMAGRVLDSKGTVVAELQTLTDDAEPGVNQGQARFSITPNAAEEYRIKIDRPSGIAMEPVLPAAKPNGVVLNTGAGVTSDAEPMTVELTGTGTERNLVVGAYARGRLLDHRRVTLAPGKSLPVTLQPTSGFGGVTRITVFEERGDGSSRQLVPLAERLVYRKPSKEVAVMLKADKQSYAPGEHVGYRISATDEKGQPVPAVAMLGVVNKSVVTMADEKTFRSMPTHFLLTAEVEKAEELEHVDVLLGSHPKALSALDLLLGVQGWRRFVERGPEMPPTPRETGKDIAVVGGVARLTTDAATATVNAVVEGSRPALERARIELEAAEAAYAAVSQPPAVAAELIEMARQRTNEAMSNQSEIERRTMAGRSVICGAVQILLSVALITALGFAALGVLRRRAFAFGVGAAVATVSVVGFVLWLGSSEWTSPAKRADAERLPRSEAEALIAGQLRERAPAVPLNLPESPYAGGIAIQPGLDQAFMPQAVPDVAAVAAPAPPSGVALGAPFGGEEVRRAGKPAATSPNSNRGRPAGKGAATAGLGGRPVKDRLEQLRKKAKGDPERQLAPELRMPATARAEVGRRALDDLEDVPTAPFVVREYAHIASPKSDGVRDDFTETVFWHPALVLPGDGLSVSFDLSDSVTRYQVLSAVHTADGRLGAARAELVARKPLTVEPKLPVEVTAGDRIDVPVTVANETDTARDVRLSVESPGLVPVGPQPSLTWKQPANSRDRRVFGFRPLHSEGTARLRFALAGEDAVEAALPVVPDGFPVAGSVSAELRSASTQTVKLPATWVADTLKCDVVIYPTPLADLQRGLEGLLRDPYGCFEQTSTTNYPNTLILDYLRETNQANPAAVSRAKAFLDKGYARLTSFEVKADGKREGYEWFGHAPAHEALTAYGLLQFRDMARVAEVDPAMMARTRNYLMSRRDGRGGFQKSRAALDSFGRAPDDLTNAYIVWAVTESGRDDDVAAELDQLQRQADSATDSYFLALVANALLNRDRAEQAANVLGRLAKAQAADGSVPGATVSITGSRGAPLIVETTALAVLAWLKADTPEFNTPARNAVKWVSAQRNGQGDFGPTQSTILALKSLVAYARKHKQPPEAGMVTLSVNGREVARCDYAADRQEAIVLDVPDAGKILRPGDNTVTVSTTGKNTYPMTLGWNYRTVQPPSADQCAVRLTTKLDRAELAEGETTRLNVLLENAGRQGQGMTVAVVGLPAGLRLPDDFKQLRDLARLRDGRPGPIGFFEVRGRELVLYWRDLAPNAKVDLALDVIAHTPGRYRGPASRAYLYYDPEVKHWTPPLAASITQKN